MPSRLGVLRGGACPAIRVDRTLGAGGSALRVRTNGQRGREGASSQWIALPVVQLQARLRALGTAQLVRAVSAPLATTPSRARSPTSAPPQTQNTHEDGRKARGAVCVPEHGRPVWARGGVVAQHLEGRAVAAQDVLQEVGARVAC